MHISEVYVMHTNECLLCILNVGKSWDVGFDVELDGKMMKFVMNKSENVYDATDLFMEENYNPTKYKDQIV